MSVSSADRITTIASKMLAKRGGTTQPVPHQNLREAGLTSLDMVNLVLAIELEFDIEIAESMMTPENFDTIAAIEALLSDMPKAA
jgi:acyl carrier protein